MFRRISTKLVVAVLAAVVLPFVSFAWFTDQQLADRLSRKVVEQSLLGLVDELAGQVDAFVRQHTEEIDLLAKDPWLAWSAEERDTRRMAPEHEMGSEAQFGWALLGPDDTLSPTVAVPTLDWGPDAIADRRAGGRRSYAPFRTVLTDRFDLYVANEAGAYDLLLLVRADGSLSTCSTIVPRAAPLPAEPAAPGEEPPPAALESGPVPLALEHLQKLFARDYSAEPWFQSALAGVGTRVDQHLTDLLPDPPAEADPSSRYHLGFAVPVRGTEDDAQVVGVLYALVNWRFVQAAVSKPGIEEYFRGLVGVGRTSSAYGWIWSVDRASREARIIAHKQPELYGKRVAGDEIRQPGLVEDLFEREWGLHRPYEFNRKLRSAAFRWCQGVDRGGFDWVVGVGIDNDDIYANANQLRALLIKSTCVVLLVVLLWTLVIARHTSRPILALVEHAERVGQGDLSVQTPVKSQDEVGELTLALNRMTVELKDNREKLIRAEKDAAWREMARQIAHDIKNPLTPIQLSLDLVARARAEKSPETEAILERTLAMMRRQVEQLREIATDFYEFTGGRKPRIEALDARGLLSDALELQRAHAQELGVELVLRGEGRVLADRGKLTRVLGNLVSNALQAMRTGGGRLEASLAPAGERLAIEIRDQGHGLTPEARAHLFEPYFTTRSEGTGLGLAIAKRALDEMDGSIELVERPAGEGRGTLARVLLPRAPEPSA